jgi:hypothetical protein
VSQGVGLAAVLQIQLCRRSQAGCGIKILRGIVLP